MDILSPSSSHRPSHVFHRGGFEVVDDFLSQNVGIKELVRLFEAIVSEPQDVEAGLVAPDTKDSDSKC
jgi:hypothetical protein